MLDSTPSKNENQSSLTKYSKREAKNTVHKNKQYFPKKRFYIIYFPIFCCLLPVVIWVWCIHISHPPKKCEDYSPTVGVGFKRMFCTVSMRKVSNALNS